MSAAVHSCVMTLAVKMVSMQQPVCRFLVCETSERISLLATWQQTSPAIFSLHPELTIPDTVWENTHHVCATRHVMSRGTTLNLEIQSLKTRDKNKIPRFRNTCTLLRKQNLVATKHTPNILSLTVLEAASSDCLKFNKQLGVMS